MKANELMIGDWIRDNELSVAHQWEEDDFGTDLIVCVKPIPLTEEILMANGFDCKGQLKVLYRKPYEIAVRLDNNYSEICIAEMVYNPEDTTETNWQADIELNHSLRVHELQHALRLCGLNELADNLKLN